MSSTQIETTRDLYHSVHDQDRKVAIEILCSMPDPIASRELIQLYEECQWRTDRLQIIQGLSQFPTQRSLEFLFRLARKTDDIPIAEAAIWSLGQTHHRLASLFLISFYSNSNDLIKPSIVGALGQIPEQVLIDTFLKELPLSIRERKDTLTKNLVLTLGELKAEGALPLLQDLIRLPQNLKNSEMKLSALMGIGKISRDTQLIESLESYFRNDPFQYQLFTNTKTQVQFRAQWKLEDYLSKLFESTSIHKTLPFELTHFDPKEVKEGLKLYCEDQHFNRLCFTLSKLNFPDISDWYLEFFNLKTISTEKLEQILNSMSGHLNSSMAQPLSFIFKHRPECWQGWLDALSKCLPDAEIEFKSFFESSHYKALPDDLRIAAMNHLYHYGICIQTDGKKLQSVGKLFETLLENELIPKVQGRIIRALAGLGIPSKKGIHFVKDCIKSFPQESDHEKNSFLFPSCLQFFEFCTEKNQLSFLLLPLEKVNQSKLAPKIKTSYIKALAALPSLPHPHSELDLFLKNGLHPSSSLGVKMAVLNLLQKHPRPSLLSSVLACLKMDKSVQLAAVIALKTMGDEQTADLLIPFLESQHTSLSGRALDTLTFLPGLRAKRIVIDYLNDHSEDLDICDKVIRCLHAPETGNDYFSSILDGILKRSPLHEHRDGFILLRERVSPKKSNLSPEGLKAKGIDIQAIDQELTLKINGYSGFNEAVKSTLRSAELPYKHRELFDEYVDKASAIVEYCKGVDLLLEKTLGKAILFPKLERVLHEFQTFLHGVGLNESYPNAENVLIKLELDSHFTTQTLPLHKMTLLSQAIFSGRIVNEHFKVLDGLRAWAVMLLLFGRGIQNRKPLIPTQTTTDKQIIHFCKRLMALQDIRNPLAHRQTALSFLEIDKVRSEVFSLLGSISKLII